MGNEHAIVQMGGEEHEKGLSKSSLPPSKNMSGLGLGLLFLQIQRLSI